MTVRPPSSIPEIVADRACRLGSGPVWHPASKLLYWIDARAGTLYSFDPAAAKSAQVTLGDKVIQIVPFEDGGLLLFTASGELKVYRPHESPKTISRLPWDPRAHIDAAVSDGRGKVYCAMREAGSRSGSLYRVGADGKAEHVVAGIGCVYGLAFDEDIGSLYCCDAVSREILRLTHHADSGAVSGRQMVLQVPGSLGIPRGLAVDSKGFLWVPVWGGSCALRVSPDGREERRVYFTAKLLSGIAFGGTDLRDLYVVSSGAEDRRTNGPGAGALFRLRQGVKGAPTAPAH